MPSGGRLPGVLGQLPAVAALDLAEQPGDKPADPSAGLRPLEAWPDPVAEPLKRLGPVGDPRLGRLPDPHDAPTTPQSTQDHHPTQLSKLPARCRPWRRDSVRRQGRQSCLDAVVEAGA
jgi:hypothetical protein